MTEKIILGDDSYNLALTARRADANESRTWNFLHDGSEDWYLSDKPVSEGSLAGSRSRMSGPFSGWREALRSVPGLTVLTSDRPVHFEGEIDSLQLVSELTCGSDEDPASVDWPEAEVGSIGEQKIYFIPNPATGSFVAVLGNEYGIDGRCLAQYSWSDDYFPMTTTYTCSLIEYAPGSAVVVPEGDIRESVESHFVNLTEDPVKRASAILTWAELMLGADSALKLALPCLDPHGRLTLDQRQEWEVALNHPCYEISLDLDDQTESVLLRSIEENIQNAFENPLGREGQALLKALKNDDILVALNDGTAFQELEDTYNP